MHYTLMDHSREYRLSNFEIITSVMTGFLTGGLPYAARHWELANRMDEAAKRAHANGRKSNERNHGLRHRIIAIIQAMPLLGALAALIEWIVVRIYYRVKAPNWYGWEPGPKLSVEEAQRRSQSNFFKAVEKHARLEKIEIESELRRAAREEQARKAHAKKIAVSSTPAEEAENKEAAKTSGASKTISGAFLTQKEFEALGKSESLPSTFSSEETPLELLVSSKSCQGIRSEMEDSDSVSTKDRIFAIWDGHGGCQTAKFASEVFPERFKAILGKSKEKNAAEIRYAFEQAVHSIQKDVFHVGRRGGSVGVATYVHDDIMYVYTLGDCEVTVYRKIRDENGRRRLKGIPLSRCINWKSIKEKARLLGAMTEEEAKALEKLPASSWRSGQFVKGKYIPGIDPNNPDAPAIGPNVCNAIGDIDYIGTKEKPLITHRMKMTAIRLLPGDFVDMTCDGGKEGVKERKAVGWIEGLLKCPKDWASFATYMAHLALRSGSKDNITRIDFLVRKAAETQK